MILEARGPRSLGKYGCFLVRVIFLASCSLSPRWLSGTESACQCRRCSFNLWVREIAWGRKQNLQPTPAFLSGKSHGQRNVVGYSPWGLKEFWKLLSMHTCTVGACAPSAFYKNAILSNLILRDQGSNLMTSFNLLLPYTP